MGSIPTAHADTAALTHPFQVPGRGAWIPTRSTPRSGSPHNHPPTLDDAETLTFNLVSEWVAGQGYRYPWMEASWGEAHIEP